MSESILARVRALMARARDAGSSEAEAATCAQRARRLMDEHGISMLEAEGGRPESVDKHDYRAKYTDPWRKDLANQTAKYFGCQMVVGGGLLTFVGRESSRVVAVEMYEYLEQTTLRLAREWRREVGGTRGDQLNFERGCGTRIAKRLQDMRLAASATSEVAGCGVGVPMVVTELKESEDWMRANMSTRTVQFSSKIAGDGGRAGRAAGDKVHLGGQVGGSSSTRRLS